MKESSKYDFFMDELSSLEKQMYVFLQRDYELSQENIELMKKLEYLEKENEVLQLKMNELEENLQKRDVITSEGKEGISLNVEEKEQIKNKIDDLISKIDYHLRS